jgi:hypothetical protein
VVKLTCLPIYDFFFSYCKSTIVYDCVQDFCMVWLFCLFFYSVLDNIIGSSNCIQRCIPINVECCYQI